MNEPSVFNGPEVRIDTLLCVLTRRVQRYPWCTRLGMCIHGVHAKGRETRHLPVRFFFFSPHS